MTQEVSDSKIHFRCSKCQAKYSALPEQSGKKGICKECGAQIKVPNPDSALSKAGDAAITVRRIWIPQTLASGMLVWALYPDNPYGYYILLRWVCCGVFAYLAYQAFDREKQGWVWALGITALFYNPIFSVHLNRELWSIINVVTIGIAVVSIFALKFDKDGQLRGRNGNAEIDLIKDRRRFAEEFILYMFPELLCGIDDDPFMCPSQAAEYANFEHEQRGDDSHADPRIVSVAYGCLAGVILLSFEQFLRNEMAPKIKSATQIAQEKMTDEILSVAAWPGFEDEVINGVKEKLYEWAASMAYQ